MYLSIKAYWLVEADTYRLPIQFPEDELNCVSNTKLSTCIKVIIVDLSVVRTDWWKPYGHDEMHDWDLAQVTVELVKLYSYLKIANQNLIKEDLTQFFDKLLS